VHAGGTAEEAHAVLSVTPGATLYVEVGGVGLDASATTNAPGPAGGFNGGGAGSGGDNTSISSASGGGASDVRTSPSTDLASLGTRLIVAGGGGGASSCGAGGAAGEPGQGSQPCQTSYTGGGAGTTTQGGLGGYPATPGSQGHGGVGGFQPAQGSDTGNLGGGGGGGGDYGGGGGGPTAGGGGGSSYVPPGALNTITLTASPAVVEISYTVPVLSISIATHPNVTVDATSAVGAVFHYTAPAVTDEANPTDPPAAVCSPPSGSTFAIGTTTVTCTATDAADSNSPVSSTFTVTIVGAPGQLTTLHQAVWDYGPALASTVLIAEHAVSSENTPRACLALDAFVVEVATRIPPLPPVTRADLIAAAGQIQAVLACGDSWLP
jgi:glycine rich protein/HYR domain-containing protein